LRSQGNPSRGLGEKPVSLKLVGVGGWVVGVGVEGLEFGVRDWRVGGGVRNFYSFCCISTLTVYSSNN